MGFGPTLAAAKLGKVGWVVEHETVRRWLVAEGLWRPQRAGAASKVAEKKHFGQLVQMDGSSDHWFEDGEKCCLIHVVDDATGRALALLCAQGTTEAAMRLLWAWIARYGMPRALSTDWQNVYLTEREPTVAEKL